MSSSTTAATLEASAQITPRAVGPFGMTVIQKKTAMSAHTTPKVTNFHGLMRGA